MSRRGSACGVCGGTEMVDAVDNHGKAYRGCARCTITATPSAPEPRDALVARLTAERDAMRAERDAAYERAAKVCDTYAHENGCLNEGTQDDDLALGAEACARLIRAIPTASPSGAK